MAKPAENQDRQQAAAFLRLITSQWYTLREKAHIELRALFPGKAPQIARFAPDDTGIELAVDFACMFSAQGYNIYPVINPVRASAPLRRDGKQTGATDDDIICSFFCWADGDDEAAVYAIKNFAGPKYSFAVTTGKTPFPRPHIYWALEEPIHNLTTWTQIQRGIAAQLSTDKTVVNPSRIMRLPGMINWPTEKKAAKGYVAELATLRTEYEDERAPVSAERMWRIFGEAGERAAQPAGTGFQIDTGDEFQRLDVDETLQGILSGDHWNHRVNQLVWRMAALGLTDSEIGMLAPGLTLPGYTVEESRAEMMTMLRYARAAGNKPKSDQDEASSQAVEKDSSGVITGLRIQSSPEFLADLTPAVYVVDGVLAERRCLSLTGFAGHGKTTLALHLAIQVATGGHFGGMECEQGSVLILAGENPDNVKWQYAAALAAAGVKNEIPVHFLPGHFQLSAFLGDLLEKAQSIPNLRLVIIDSLQAFFEGENDNGNVEMMEAARRFRKLSEIPDGPTVLVIAHPAGKRPDKTNIVPRGGSSFGNEFDGNLTVWAEPDGTQVFHHSEKFRGAPFEPLTFVMDEREFDHLKDHKDRPLRLKVSRQQMVIEAASAAQKTERREHDAIAAIEANPKITQRALADLLMVSKSTADRVMQTLKDEKLIRRHARKWVLTDGGKEFLDGQ